MTNSLSPPSVTRNDECPGVCPGAFHLRFAGLAWPCAPTACQTAALEQLNDRVINLAVRLQATWFRGTARTLTSSRTGYRLDWATGEYAFGFRLLHHPATNRCLA